jgi:hypothetical protein
MVLALAGCGPRSAGPSAERDARTSSTAHPPPTTITVDQHALSAAGRVAVRYALAARSWTPASYRAQHRRQLRLSTGSLRSALQRTAPTREQLAAYRDEVAHVDATLVKVARLLRTPTQSRYAIVLDERSAAAGQNVRERFAYVVELKRRDGAWLVTAFSVQP